MPLTIPPVDTRRYQDLLDEALARIPVHNPEWTNFNRSDPGVTLIEVFAFLTESLLYRANQIPERNRRAFLSLLNVPLQPGASARGIVSFSNERGPRQAITLNSGVEVRAGEVPFRTELGLDVLPIEGRAFFKRAMASPPPELQEYYRQLYASFRGQPAATDVRMYETVPFPPPASDPATAGPLEAVDQSIWIALLLRTVDNDQNARQDVREQIAGKTISLGLVPIVADAARVLRPGGAPADPAQQALRYQLPSIPASGGLSTRLAERIPQYRDLDARTGTDIFAEPGIVQLTLPTAGELTLWNNLDPLESGAADFPPALEDTNLGNRVVTWLRVRAASAAVPSQLKWIGINATTVSQRAHVINEVLPNGNGQPDQIVTLAHRPVVADSVRVRVTSAGQTEIWTAVEDLLHAGPEVRVEDPRLPPPAQLPPPAPSKVFVVNLESGEIRFGDGYHGARPPQNATLRADYDYGVGRAGNVGPRAINAGPALPAGFKVSNPERTWGGADAEPVSEGEKQISRYLQHRDRLVNAADFEAIALRTPGVEIGRVDVLPGYNPELSNEPGDAPGAVTLMLIPRSDPLQPDAPRPDRFFLNTVCDYLDPRRLITTELILRGPTYRPIWVSVGIAVVAGMSVAEVRQAVDLALRDFLSPLPPGGVQTLEDLTTVVRAPQLAERRRGWPLRKPVVALELQAVVNRVEGVLLVNSLLVASGTSAEPSIAMRGLELPRVAGISVTVGDALDLAQVRGQQPATTAASPFVPVPVVPEDC